MTPEALATLHGRAFAGQGRAWSADEFADLLNSPHAFAVRDVHSFALGRVVADEAELLTLATDPAHHRQGHASRVLAQFEAAASERGAARAFLEVAADNAPAIGLYISHGYTRIARRAGYYDTPSGRVDAVIMEKYLSRK